jgi:hypothetical protein
MHDLWQTIALIEREEEFSAIKREDISEEEMEKLFAILKLISELKDETKESLILLFLSDLNDDLSDRIHN